MKYHVSVVPRQLYFPSGQNITPWENITLLAVHRNVIFHDRPGQYLYNVGKTNYSLFSDHMLESDRFVSLPV